MGNELGNSAYLIRDEGDSGFKVAICDLEERQQYQEVVHMKSKTESRKADLVERIAELARRSQELAREAVCLYSTEVAAILKAQSRDPRRIERCLDGMLDFCFDDKMLVLYKKLCRYYINLDPEATASYVHFYREMWGDEGSRDAETKHT